MRGHLLSPNHIHTYQKVSPHIAVTEVAMPVDCRGELLNSLDLSQQFSHLKKVFGPNAAALSSELQNSICFNFVCVSHRSSHLQFCLHLKRDGDDRVVSDEEGKSARERSEVGIWESEEGKPGHKSGGRKYGYVR